MAKRDDLRRLRTNTVINATSKQQESDVFLALKATIAHLETRFGISFEHEKKWRLREIVAELRKHFPEIDFFHHFDNTSIKPDGGVLYLLDRTKARFPVLIAEVKNQGTNDLRLQEGLSKQAKGNAIERLGKNVIGLRTALMNESIFPFVCFGYGCDFEPKSSILDRVVTIAMFGELNKVYLHNVRDGGRFNRGSFFFRPARWTIEEMTNVMMDIAERSVQYYFSKYGENQFK